MCALIAACFSGFSLHAMFFAVDFFLFALFDFFCFRMLSISASR